MQQLKKIKPVHEHIMDVMLEHPDISLRELGVAVGYSVSYLSIMTNSDAFQARLAERKQQVARSGVDLPNRMRAVAAVALDKLTDHVERSEDPDFLRATADMMLHRLGYAPQKAGGAVTVQTGPQVQFVISRDDLASARGQIIDFPAEGRQCTPSLQAFSEGAGEDGMKALSEQGGEAANEVSGLPSEPQSQIPILTGADGVKAQLPSEVGLPP